MSNDSNDTIVDSDVFYYIYVLQVCCLSCGVYVCKEHTTPICPTKENSENSNDELQY